MLVLTFRIGEGAHVGRHGHITLLSIERNQVKLGFTWGPDTVVSRDTFELESHLARQQRADELAVRKIAPDGDPE